MRPIQLLAGAVLAAMPALAAAQGAAGPRGDLYVTLYNSGEIARVSGLTTTRFPQAGSPSLESALAVDGDVRTLSTTTTSPLDLGAQYALDGTPTGTTYATTVDGLYDGTTDEYFNYAVEYFGSGTGRVLRFDRDWSNATELFNTSVLGATDVLGITYDLYSKSLWLSTFTATGSQVYNVGFDGSVSGSFSVGTTFIAGLAMDYTDGTLWMTSDALNGQLENYRTDGTFIGKADIPGTAGEAMYGAEFNISAVPEPGTYALLATGLLGVAGAARRRNRSV